MSFSWLTPYAAKAIITHDFDTDHLNVFVTFRFCMDTNVTPANAKWICKLDGVTKAVTASAWQDPFTMLLTIGAIGALPARVTLAYDGPDPNLRITWLKQWEPWGAITSIGPVLLPYGSFFGNEINWTQAAAQNVWYTISDSDIAAGPLIKTSFQNNQELKVDEAGVYEVIYYLTMECSIANKHVLSAPEINGVEQLAGRNHTEFGRAGEESNISATAQLTLAVDDLISIGISTPDIGNPTIMVDHAGLTLLKIPAS